MFYMDSHVVSPILKQLIDVSQVIGDRPVADALDARQGSRRCRDLLRDARSENPRGVAKHNGLGRPGLPAVQ